MIEEATAEYSLQLLEEIRFLLSQSVLLQARIYDNLTSYHPTIKDTTYDTALDWCRESRVRLEVLDKKLSIPKNGKAKK